MLRLLTTTLARTRLRGLLILLHDSIIVASAFPISIYLRENFAPSPQLVLPAIQGSAILFMIVFVTFRAIGVHQNMWRYSSPRDLLNLGRALTIVGAIFFPLMFMVDRLDGIPRSVLVIFWFIAFAGLCSARATYFWGVHSLAEDIRRKEGRPTCRVMIVASLRSSSTIIHALETQYAGAAHIVGIVSDTGEQGRMLQGVEILGVVAQLPLILTSLDVAGCYPHAIIADDNETDWQRWLNVDLAETAPGVSIFNSSNINDLAQFIASRPKHDEIFARRIEPRGYFDVKRLLDIIIASVAVLSLLPLFALIAGLVYLFHGSPIMFTQVRAGLRLGEFRLLKFRTMKPPFDSTGNVLEDSQRVTRVGSILRMTRLDELPQFWNVLRGDMSLIGPRPLLSRDMPASIEILTERYRVRPGITGWAQVNGGHKIDNDTKMSLDIYYIRNASFLFDLKIVMMTIRMMIVGETIGHVAIRNAEAVLPGRYFTNRSNLI